MMLAFKKIKRKPTYLNMAEVTFNEIKKLLQKGIDKKKISISDEDLEYINKNNGEKIAGFIATDGDTYWFVNYNYAKNNYEIELQKLQIK